MILLPADFFFSFGSRSGPTFCRARSGYKPFAKTLADKSYGMAAAS